MAEPIDMIGRLVWDREETLRYLWFLYCRGCGRATQ